MYFNLTRIKNGWILKYSPYFSHLSTLSPASQEVFFSNFKEAFSFIEKHRYDVDKFEKGILASKDG